MILKGLANGLCSLFPAICQVPNAPTGKVRAVNSLGAKMLNRVTWPGSLAGRCADPNVIHKGLPLPAVRWSLSRAGPFEPLRRGR